MSLGSFLAKHLGGEVLEQVGRATGSVLDRVGFTKKLSEGEKIDKYLVGFGISEKSTDSARKMFIAEMQTQKQPWFIRLLNGFVRPFGGIGSLATEFYAMWAENISAWFEIPYRPINISTEQHIVLGTIIAFYFGSRLKETLTGTATKR